MPNRFLLGSALLLLTATGCAGDDQAGPAVLDAMTAGRLLETAFPDAAIEVHAMDEATTERALASVRLDDGDVKVAFRADDAGWSIDTIEQGGIAYSVDGLLGIAETVRRLSAVSDALERYREAEGEFPSLPDLSGLQILIPDYLDDSASLRDAWERGFRYARQGAEYAMTSDGPDGEPRTADDLIVVMGRFVMEQP